MPRLVNSLHGIVWAIREDTLKIALPKGGFILGPKTPGIRAGDAVAFLMDATDKKVIKVMPKEEADESVKRGSNHIYDSSVREPPLEEEDEYGENAGYQDGSVFWCPEFG